MSEQKERSTLAVEISEDVHIEAKIKAAREKRTLREIVEDALRAFLGMSSNGKGEDTEETK